MFYLLAEVSASTGTFYRAIFGLPILALVAYGEHRRLGPLPRQAVVLAAVAGVFFAADLLFWHHAIEAVGAGLATVLGNLQVILVGLVRLGRARRTAVAGDPCRHSPSCWSGSS